MASEKVLKTFDELKKLHIAKDADYSGGEPLSTFKRCEAFGIPAWKGCLIRLSDKYARIISLVGKNGDHMVAGESLADSLRDMAVYSIITLVLMDEKDNEHATVFDGDDLPTQEAISSAWTVGHGT